eukprot:SAG11_NODE_3067_length_2715_cov_1.530581_2_plen_73_part_00
MSFEDGPNLLRFPFRLGLGPENWRLGRCLPHCLEVSVGVPFADILYQPYKVLIGILRYFSLVLSVLWYCILL